MPLEPFIAATCAVLGEMVSTEVVVGDTYRTKPHPSPGNISAVVRLTAVEPGMLVLSFPEKTAAALAGRMLAETAVDVDDALVRDCMGEIANVIAGQAKALLADTPHRFTFSVPEVGQHALDLPEDVDRCVVAFRSKEGEFVLQLLWSA